MIPPGVVWCCLVSVLPLLVAGCGSDKSNGSEQLSAPAIAKAMLIKRTDLPKEWKQIRPLPPVHCVSHPFREAVATSEAHFNAGLADLQQQVAVFKSKSETERAYADLTSEQGFRCLRNRSEAEVSSYSGGQILEPLTVLQKQKLDRLGQAKRTNIKVMSPIGPVGVYLDVIYVRAGRTVIFLKISCGLNAVAEQFFNDMTRLAIRRVKFTEGT